MVPTYKNLSPLGRKTVPTSQLRPTNTHLLKTKITVSSPQYCTHGNCGALWHVCKVTIVLVEVCEKLPGGPLEVFDGVSHKLQIYLSNISAIS